MSNRRPPDRDRHTSSDDAVATALRRGAEASADARAVVEAIRDPTGLLIDLRILYANAAFWALTGMDSGTGVGRTFSSIAPAIDWTAGIAGRLFRAMESGRPYADKGVRNRPQTGAQAGQDRVFDVEFAGDTEHMSVRLRDVTADVQQVERQVAEARRTAAIGRFVATAVDPVIDRTVLLGLLADELADTIGNLCVVVEEGPGGSVLVTAVSGGPGDAAARMSAVRAGPISLPEPYHAAFLAGETALLSPITDAIRPQVEDALRWLGVPDELVGDVNSSISAAVKQDGKPIARIHLVRFGAEPPIDADDVATVEAIAASAALVLERLAVEDRLVGSLARFEAVFELAPIPMVAVDTDRSVRYNQSALELYGRSNEDMVRLAFQPDAPWIPPDQADRWEEMRRRVAVGDRLRSERLAIIRPTGERREIEGSSIQIATPDGAIRGVVTVLTDLTDQLSLEAQFRHAQKMEALGRLAGGIAHDFNNVLMAITGYADLVATRAWEGRLVDPEHADAVLAATRRAVELTARLTSFARRDTVRVETVDVAKLVRDILPLLERLTPESIEIVTRLEAAPRVTIDRSEFEQAIINLVVNAMDAMPAGGRLIIEVDPVDLDADHAATHLGAMNGPHVLVAVSDTGSGMDEATRSRIFEPFYTTKAPGEGTGLGLAMVFAAIDRAHGQIWVSSEPSHGTTFKIYLPAAASDEPETAVETVVRDEPIGGSEALLLVEDDPMVRDLLITILTASGYAVTAATRPSEAIAAAAGQHFDLLLSDLVMPDMMGTELAVRLRQTRPELRVVLMSGYTANAVGYELGPHDSFVHKPLRPTEVLRIVREALDR